MVHRSAAELGLDRVCPSLDHRLLYLSGDLNWQRFQFCQTPWILSRKFLVRLNQRHFLMPAQPPFAEDSLSRVRRRDPVVHRTRNNPYRMRRFRLLPDCDQELSAVSFLRMCESLDLVEGCFIEVNMFPERGHIAGLLANDLGTRVLHDAGSMLIRAIGRSDEILRGLADAPNPGVPLARSAKELDDDASEDRRFKQGPALIEQHDAWLASCPGCAIGSRM